jgi:predicted nuclease of predicted toxin-antitoxin system
MLSILFDAHVRSQVQDGLRLRQPALVMDRVQDIGLAEASDALILERAAEMGRVVVSADKKTLVPEAIKRIE